MNFVKEKKDCFDRIVVSILWFLIVFGFGNLCYWIVKFPYIPLRLRNYIYAGFFSYIAYLVFRVLLSSFKTTFFEIKLKDENEIKGTEKYLQWYLGKEPLIANLLDIKHENNILFFPDNDASIKYHCVENIVYETFSNRRFWNIFCPFIRTDELTLEEINYIVNTAIYFYI